MLTYKFFSNKYGNLILRLRNNNRKTEINLHLSITQEELDKIMANSSGKNAATDARMKKIISGYVAALNRICVEMVEQRRTNEDVMETRKLVEVEFGLSEKPDPADTGNFVEWYEKFMDSKTNKGTKRIYFHTLARMKAFDPSLKKKSFEDIDMKWLAAFENFCALTACKNARNIHLRNIRAVFNNAIDYEATTAYPFRRFKIRPEATRKRSLSVEELRKLFNYPVEPYAEIYRDMFKLIFMLIGINTVDLHRLKSITSDGRIEYKRAKTGRLYSVKVEPEALEIIKKYQGAKGLLCVADRWSDHRNFGRQTNNALQKIGAVERKGRGGKKIVEAEFEELTTYWARHSWATIAASIDIPKDTIAHALGHGGNTVTDVYIDFDQRKVDEANRRVLDWVLYGKR